MQGKNWLSFCVMPPPITTTANLPSPVWYVLLNMTRDYHKEEASNMRTAFLHDNNCVLGTRTQPPNFCASLIGCPVQLISEVFLRLHCVDTAWCRHTFASLWGACYRFASLWRANSRGDSFVLCWGLLFCLRKVFTFYSVLNLRKVYIFWEFADGLRSMCVCWIKAFISFKSVLNLRKAYIFQDPKGVYGSGAPGSK